MRLSIVLIGRTIRKFISGAWMIGDVVTEGSKEDMAESICLPICLRVIRGGAEIGYVEYVTKVDGEACCELLPVIGE